MKRCILHLGMPKTASTSIQTALLENRKLLKSYGWEYPVFTCPQHGHTFILQNDPLCRLFMPAHPFHVQRPLKNGVIDLDIQQKGLRKALDGYCQNESKLVLSSEALLRPIPLRRIAEYMDSQNYAIEPIVYVRSPYSYRVSLYQSLLKFSQFPAATISKHLNTPVVKSAVSAAMDVFGDSVKFYPFNNLVGASVDIVKHFLSHFLDDNVCSDIQVSQENRSPSWQAIALLEYIEEKSPLYVGNIKNNKRRHGDIKPLLRLEGEKFRFDSGQLANFKEVIDMENSWLRDCLGEEFCDVDYMSQVAAEAMVWTEGNIQSLLRILPGMPDSIQLLILDYFESQAKFASSCMKNSTLVAVRKNIMKKKLFDRHLRFEEFFPAETRRGGIARKVWKLFAS